jgi:apolipoprotein N-acyltransferase
MRRSRPASGATRRHSHNTKRGAAGPGGIVLPVRFVIRVALTAAAAGLLIFSFPPFHVGVLSAWCALVPLLAVINHCRSRARAAGWGAIFGLAANSGIFAWLLAVPGVHLHQFAALDALYSVFPALWCALVHRLDFTRSAHQVYAAAAWTCLEHLRGHAGFLAFPWATLAQTQVDDVWIAQVAAWAGEAGLSFLVLLGNTVVFGAGMSWLSHATRPGARTFSLQPLVMLLPILSALLFGAVSLHRGFDDSRTIPVSALRTPYVSYGPQAISPQEQMQRTLGLLAERGGQVSADARPGITVLPETAFINLDGRSDIEASIRRIAFQREFTLIFGVGQAAKFERGSRIPTSAGALAAVTNAAWALLPDTPAAQRYYKVELVPFAEYLPLRSQIRWPRFLVGTPLQVVPGPGPRLFAVSARVRIGPLICWEALFSAHSRALAQMGATVLALLSNDGWFAGRAVGEQHNLIARLRAIETHRPLVIASNRGESLIVDAYGRIRARSTEDDGPQWISADIEPSEVTTPYVRFGDVCAWWCIAVTLLGAVALLGGFRRRTPYQESPGKDLVPPGGGTSHCALAHPRIGVRNLCHHAFRGEQASQ